MPEIKHNFIQGKMDKDSDERLIKNGQYRDANNIEVFTSEGSNVGVVQSLKGNTSIANISTTSTFAGGICVGSYSDEKNNCAYWFVATNTTWNNTISPTTVQTFRDVIYRTTHGASSDNIEPVFVDFWLEKHPTPSSGWVGTGGIYTGVALTSVANLSVGMWIYFVTATGGRVRKIASIASSTITFDESVQITDLTYINHLEFTWEPPMVYGRYGFLTLFNETNFYNRILRFNSNYLITGINVIDDLLVWTDNNSEPKKINITRALAGTTNINTTSKIRTWDNTSTSPTYLTYQYINFYKESDVTVSKQGPKTSPKLELVDNRSSKNLGIDMFNTFDYDFSSTNEHDRLTITLNELHSYSPNDTLIVRDTLLGLPTYQDFDIKLRVVSAGANSITVVVDTINSVFAVGVINFQSILLEDNKSLFDDKLVRFATRWKYVDGEYSTFSPFSKPAFLPGDFLYNTRDCYNTGMENTLKEVVIKDFIPKDISGEVDQVEILYKESDSPVIYSLDRIKPTDVMLPNTPHHWSKVNESLSFTGNYKIISEKVYSAIESNQILRPWDSVPKKAKSQEIVGNRIVYGNYLQNYNIDPLNEVLIETHLISKKDVGAEMLLNPNADPINPANGTTAEGWSMDSTWGLIDYYGYWFYGGGFQNVRLPAPLSVVQYHKVSQNITFKDDNSYRLRFKIKESNFFTTGSSIRFVLVAPNKYGYVDIDKNSSGSSQSFPGDGEYEIDISLTLNNTAITLQFLNAQRSFLFQSMGGPGFEFEGEISDISVKHILDELDISSIKSQRTYQLGVVYADNYGRQTPVLTNSSASFKVPKLESLNKNSISARLQSFPPSFAKHFKYYVKETSKPYYNLAVNKIYKADDYSVWVSFPSSERNKIDEDSYLILKKGFEGGAVLEEEATYKVTAIESNPPEYIKTVRNTVAIIAQENVTGDTSLGDSYFSVANRRPLEDSTVLAIQKATWEEDGFGPNLVDIQEKLSLKFFDDTHSSKWYDFDNISVKEISNIEYYIINIDNPITNGDASWVLDGTIIPNFVDGVKMKIAKKVIENKIEFDGQFFVKILLDANIEQYLLTPVISNAISWKVLAREQVYYLSDGGWKMDNGSNDAALSLTTLTPGYVGEFDIRTRASGHGDAAGFGAQPFLHGFELATPYRDISSLSSYSPSYGCVYKDFTQPGTPSGQYVREFRVSRDAFEKWTRILKLKLTGILTLDGPNEEARQGFFIDKSSYIGIQPQGDYNPKNGVYRASRADETGSIYAPHHKNEGNYFWHNNTSTLFSTTTPGNNVAPINMPRGGGLWQSQGNEVHFKTGQPDNWFTPGNYYMEISYAKMHSGLSAWNITASQVNSASSWTNAWDVGLSTNPQNYAVASFVSRINSGSLFRFTNDPALKVYKIKKYKKQHRYNHTAFPFGDSVIANLKQDWSDPGSTDVQLIRFNDLPYLINYVAPRPQYEHLNFVYLGGNRGGKISTDFNGNVLSTNTYIGDPNKGPQEQMTLAYEKTMFGAATNRRVTWILEISELPGDGSTYKPINDTPLTPTSPETSSHNISQFMEFVENEYLEGEQLESNNPAIFETKVKENEGLDVYYEASDFISIGNWSVPHQLPWFNCYSFGNGVESMRIKDDFNEVYLDKQVIASTTLETYRENHRKHGLVYSGVYNSSSGINNLNQFIAAENITKDVNPVYGSIQKLNSRNADLQVFCEDKVLKILSKKDALYSADGDVNLITTNKFLGQVVPYVGDYGISRNPESFSSDNYRTYFVDKQRGAVLRLSRDGITPISDVGMQTWFKDNLKNAVGVLGSFDTNKKEYNVTIKAESGSYTLSYSEGVKGWSSFKTFIPEEALSVENEYFSIANADTTTNNQIWKHHTNSVYNNFYGKTPTAANGAFSSVTVVLNDEPSIVKNFMTLNYEGTQAKVDQNTADTNNYYNLVADTGWYAETITTDKQTGSLNEFLEKEGKWFNFIKGDTTYYTSASDNNLDTEEFTVQGLGKITAHDTLN